MAFKKRKYAVGVFSVRQDVEVALCKLKNAGFSLEKVWLFANGWINRAIGEEEDISYVLVQRGIPLDRAKFYKSQILKGNFLLLIENAGDKIEQAEEILLKQGIKELEVYPHQHVFDARYLNLG
jgi:hypothetical protein